MKVQHAAVRWVEKKLEAGFCRPPNLINQLGCMKLQSLDHAIEKGNKISRLHTNIIMSNKIRQFCHEFFCVTDDAVLNCALSQQGMEKKNFCAGKDRAFCSVVWCVPKLNPLFFFFFPFLSRVTNVS